MASARSLDSLNERFGIPGAVRFEAGQGGLVRAAVTVPAAEAHVYLHGAHVTHYRPAGHHALLFLSERSHFVEGKAIRGGVPVIFPWFGARAGDPTAPDHGFARTREWALESVERSAVGSVAVTLSLEPDDATRRMWPHDFRLRHRIVFGARLEMALEVVNRSGEPFTFEEALHTYLLVGDVRQASVTGLGAITYIDKTDEMKRKTLASEPLVLTRTTDRVFVDTRGPCAVSDPVLARRLVVDKDGSATTVVWNPWSDRAATMADLGHDEWRSMLCLEAANAADNALHLAGGQQHTMRVVIQVAAP
ncbi:MAG TPA: D-hexose-6-phosphate mutarotase [Candidatus Methylomirabilis sp.]|nr:D-hexose-6-phosphate mutarotase [Candidatus Methylomirabilis sp.]